MILWCKLRRSRHSTLSAPHCCCPLRPLTHEPDLRSQNCFHRSLQPWRPLILCRCARRRTRPSSPCTLASVHVRLSDDGVASTDTAALGPELRWLRARAQKRLAVGSSLYIASNVPMGVRSAALAPLCSGRGSFNCSDQGTLHAQETQTWRSLVGSLELLAGTLALALDQLLCASAARGFFSTSKFCGPPGFRRSTFSEGIALRWQLQHGKAPLCAHGMELSLLKGASAHGAFVY